MWVCFNCSYKWIYPLLLFEMCGAPFSSRFAFFFFFLLSFAPAVCRYCVIATIIFSRLTLGNGVLCIWVYLYWGGWIKKPTLSFANETSYIDVFNGISFPEVYCIQDNSIKKHMPKIAARKHLYSLCGVAAVFFFYLKDSRQKSHYGSTKSGG